MNIYFFDILANPYPFNTYKFAVMDANKELRLRLRFYKDVPQNIDALRVKFADYAQIKSKDYFVKIRGYHIWLNIKGQKKAYWSPHLHIEMESKDQNETHIRALFGPDPTLWTLFMFFHFIIAGIFLIFSGITYTDYILKNSITFDLVVMGLMIFVWFLLYIVAKQIRSNGHDQMNDLENVFLKIIES